MPNQAISMTDAARIALRFLNRAQISGEEVDSFFIARQLLGGIINGELIVSDKSTPEDDRQSRLSAVKD
jgi:hypothetical protein